MYQVNFYNNNKKERKKEKGIRRQLNKKNKTEKREREREKGYKRSKYL